MGIKEMNQEDKAILDGFFLFQGLAPELTQGVAGDERCRLQEFNRGDVIYDPEHFTYALGLILTGRVEVRQQPEDKGLILRIHRPGDAFGVAAMFAESNTYVARLTALEYTRVLFFSQQLLTELMQRDFTAAKNYITFLSGRIQFLNHRIQSLISDTAEKQLARYLDANAGNEAALVLDISISKLAQRLNTSRASLYRAFDSLREKGLIKKSGNYIAILNRDGLNTL